VGAVVNRCCNHCHCHLAWRAAAAAAMAFEVKAEDPMMTMAEMRRMRRRKMVRTPGSKLDTTIKLRTT